MSKLSWLCLIGEIVAVCHCLCAADISDVEAQWRKRQDEIHSVVFHWRQNTASQENGFKEESQEVELRLRGGLFDLREGAIGAGTPSENPAHRAAFDGSESQVFTLEKGRSSIFYSKKPYAFSKNNVHQFPVVMALRPFSLIAPVLVRDLTILDDQLTIAGVKCIGLRDNSTSIIVSTLWVDPIRGYLPLRFESTVKGLKSIQQEIAYTNDPEFGWIPDRWSLEFFTQKGTLNQQTECVRLGYSINRPLDGGEFQIPVTLNTVEADLVGNKAVVRKN